MDCSHFEKIYLKCMKLPVAPNKCEHLFNLWYICIKKI